jgi:hypothetical protein
MDDEVCGIWGYIVEVAAPAELAELKRIIGSRVIDENQVRCDVATRVV